MATADMRPRSLPPIASKQSATGLHNASQHNSVSEEDAAAVLSVVEGSAVMGKLSARTVPMPEQLLAADDRSPQSEDWVAPGLAVADSADGSETRQLVTHLQQRTGIMQQPRLPELVSEQHMQQGNQLDNPKQPLLGQSSTQHALLAYNEPQQHAWESDVALLPGAYDDAGRGSSSNTGAGSSADTGQETSFLLPVESSDHEQLSHDVLLQATVYSNTSGTPIRLSSSCGNLSSLEGTATGPSIAKSRLGRIGGVDAASAAATCDDTAGITQGLVSSLRGTDPGIRFRSVAGGVGDEHSGGGQWHSSNWALERSASNCSLGTDDGAARKLRIHCVTFNMGSKVPSSLPPALLGQPQPSSSGRHDKSSTIGAVEGEVDLYVFATQESGSISEWERLISSSLPAGVGYERLAWQTLRAIHLVLYASPRFRKQVLGVQGSAIATGIGNLVGNKGAVALSIQLIDLKLLFVGSHFAAHDDKVERRNADFARIKAGLFTSSSYSSLTDLARSSGSISGDSSLHSTSGATAGFGTLVRTANPDASTCGTATVKTHVNWCAQQEQQQLPGSMSGAASTSPRAWLTGFWRQCTTPDNPTLSCNGIQSHRLAVDASFTSGTEHVSAAHEGVAEADSPAPLPRSVSCPAPPVVGATSWGSSDNEQHQAPDGSAQHDLVPADSGTAAPVPSHSDAAGDYTQLGSQAAAVPPPHSKRGTVSFAGDMKSHAGFSDSFTLKKPTRVTRDPLARGSKSLNVSGDITADHDVVFWAGDLNYRINGNPKVVGHLLRSRLHEVLHANDQLRLQQKKGRVFQGFQEGKIHFPPTFKYTPGTCDYSEQRVPSWTDRILWKVRAAKSWEGSVAPSVVQYYYSSVPEVLSSDHKPVVAGFDLVIAAAELPSEQGEGSGLRSKCIIM